MTDFNRKIISIHDDEELNEAEVILKQTVNTTVRKLPLATFQEHRKQSDGDGDGDGDGGDKLTNQSVGGVQRARQLAEQNREDTLPAVYGGLFNVAEYFTRSFDAIKGKFFEKVIAVEEESHRLDVDRNLGNLTQYLLEPELCWKSLDYTSETLSEDEEDRLSDLGSITLDLEKNNKQANSDATIFLEEEGILVFGEHRTSVVSGGTTARPSLMRKPKALVRELTKSNSVITVPSNISQKYDVATGSHTLTELLDEVGVDEIHFHIGILFNEKRTPARWEEDPQQGTSRRLMEQFEGELPRDITNNLSNIRLDAENLKIEFDVPVSPDGNSTISFHLSFLYGDMYLNTIYSGSLAGVGKGNSLSVFDSPSSLRDIISDNEADDLWLGFSVAERENKVFEMSQENKNNATEMADMIIQNKKWATRLSNFRSMLLNKERKKADEEILSFARDLAKQYNDQRDNRYVEGVYGGDPLNYLQDVAIEVLVYDAISRPIFLRRFPKIDEANNDRERELAEARRTFENYLFDIESDTEKKRKIYRCVRNKTLYSQSSNNIPKNEDDSINWVSAPTSSDVGDVLDIRPPTTILNSMADGTKDTEGGILIKKNNKYAVPVDVAHLIGPYMREIPSKTTS